MSPMRRRIAERLVQVQQTAAILTTFNEVDMTYVMQLRKTHQDAFQQETRRQARASCRFSSRPASTHLAAYPEVNAEVRGNDIVYHNYYDIGVAVGGERGLVVPGAAQGGVVELSLKSSKSISRTSPIGPMLAS